MRTVFVVASLVILTSGSAFAEPISQSEAVQSALSSNPSLLAVAAEARGARWGVSAEESRYQFVVGADTNYVQSHTPRLGTNDTVSSNLTRSLIVGADLSRQLSVGTNVELRVESEYFQNEFGGGFNNPTLNQSNGFGSTVKLSMTQPLLRGAGKRNGEFELRLARSTSTEAGRAERRELSRLIRDTLIAYGEVWYAAQALEIEEASLMRAQEQLEESQAKVRTGSLSPAETLSFLTEVAESREGVAAAKAEIQYRSIELQKLLGSSSSSETLVPSEAPVRVGSPSQVELEAALDEDSVEIADLQARVETAEIQARMAAEDLRPRLDVRASLQTTGLGESVHSAISRTAQFNWMTGMVTLEFEAPIGSQRKNALSEQALAKVVVAQHDLQEARNQVASDAQRAQVRRETAQKNLELAEETRRIAEETLKAEQGRYGTGTGLAIQVREADDAVRRALLREARARIDLSAEEITLQYLAGGLLREAQKLGFL